jgi:hypothetical protein
MLSTESRVDLQYLVESDLAYLQLRVSGVDSQRRGPPLHLARCLLEFADDSRVEWRRAPERLVGASLASHSRSSPAILVVEVAGSPVKSPSGTRRTEE